MAASIDGVDAKGARLSRRHARPSRFSTLYPRMDGRDKPGHDDVSREFGIFRTIANRAITNRAASHSRIGPRIRQCVSA
jgi:hypothetical protein